jgi:hypothetical protein
MEIAYRDDQVLEPGVHQSRGQIRVQVRRLQPRGPGEEIAIRERLAEHRRQLRHPHGCRVKVDLHAELAHRNDLGGGRRDPPLAHQHESGPERGMARERQLLSGREDPHRVPVAGGLTHEGRLGEADLAREHLHRLGVDLDRLRNYAQLVAGERPGREHVYDPERDAHGGTIPGRCYRWPMADRRGAGYRDGARAMAPLTIAIVGFGFSFGVLARGQFGWPAAVAMSATTFAGSARSPRIDPG